MNICPMLPLCERAQSVCLDKEMTFQRMDNTFSDKIMHADLNKTSAGAG